MKWNETKSYNDGTSNKLSSYSIDGSANSDTKNDNENDNDNMIVDNKKTMWIINKRNDHHPLLFRIVLFWIIFIMIFLSDDF